jgi:hypothetical protein
MTAMNDSKPASKERTPPAVNPSEIELPYIKEFGRKVARYFLDFLESDFKKVQAPRRRIQLKNDAGFRTAIPLRKYPTLFEAVWKLATKAPTEKPRLSIAPRKYVSRVSPLLRDLIEKHIAAIPAEKFQRTRLLAAKVAEQKVGLAFTSPESYVEAVQIAFVEEAAHELVSPLLTILEDTFKQNAYSAVESIYEIETDLVDALTSPVIENLPSALNTYVVSKDSSPVQQVLKDFFDDDAARERLVKFFAEFATADAYQELRDLLQYASTNESLQMYLYLSDMRFSAHLYPIFYLPVRVSFDEAEAKYELEIEPPHLYVNKGAIDFVQQERAKVAAINFTSPIKDRIVYLDGTAPKTPISCERRRENREDRPV